MKSSWLQPLVKDQLSLYVFVSVLLVVGVIFGTLMVHALTLEQQEDLAGDVNHFVQMLSSGMGPDQVQSFWDRAWLHTRWLVLIWLLGISVIGMPLVLALDFLKGVLIGFTVGILIQGHGWHGVLFSLLSVAPPNLIVLPALLIVSVSSISFSIHLVKQRLMLRQGKLRHPFLSHASIAFMMLAALWAAALLEAYLSPHLMSWASGFLSTGS
ncbi:stage II sporulation protein M [Paenibacillus daejeonensis]|uniref:stage II sporulation protein M n=1 Tax=Paenibacillus daejeonensis TaxID=135193 RepID=UPI00036401E9|nr:stage II sporulation protein M [Paenibacillus daejeonensis]